MYAQTPQVGYRYTRALGDTQRPPAARAPRDMDDDAETFFHEASETAQTWYPQAKGA